MPDKKAIFDAVRKMLGRGFTAEEVTTLDDALDGRITPDAPSKPEELGAPSKIGRDGMVLIKEFEGCHKLQPDKTVIAYPDPGTGNLPITIGWGSTKGMDGQPIKRGTVLTQLQVDLLFQRDMGRYAADVIQALGPALARTSQKQFDALVSFHYNTGAIARATLTAKHRAGNVAGAAAEFAKWNKAGGRVMAGLTRRRAAEAALYKAGS